MDHEQIAADKKKLKKKISSAKDGKIKKDKYTKTTKKSKKAKQEDAKIEEVEPETTTISTIERVEAMYAHFNFDINKDYKTLTKILGKSASKRVASAYLIELCKIIRSLAPFVVLSESTPIKGTHNGHKEIPDRAFRISTNYEKKIFIIYFYFHCHIITWCALL